MSLQSKHLFNFLQFIVFKHLKHSISIFDFFNFVYEKFLCSLILFNISVVIILFLYFIKNKLKFFLKIFSSQLLQ